MEIKIVQTIYKDKRLTIDEFTKLSRKEQLDIWYSSAVYDKIDLNKHTFKKIDNDSKLGYYLYEERLAIGSHGNFYKFIKLVDYVVYNKLTKKVSLHKSRLDYTALFDFFIDDYIKKDYVPLFKIINGNYLTKTLIKKIIEKKINNIEDLLKYHKSYTCKSKDVDISHLYDLVAHCRYSAFGLYKCIEDPENIKEEMEKAVDIDKERLQSSLFYSDPLSINPEYYKLIPFKIKASDIINVNVKYDEFKRNYESEGVD